MNLLFVLCLLGFTTVYNFQLHQGRISSERNRKSLELCSNPLKAVNLEHQIQLRDRLMEYIEREREGYINHPNDLDLQHGWQSKISLTCKNNHRWRTSAYNLLKLHTWCPRCAHLLTIHDYQQTAEWFNGTFLGFVSSINPLIRLKIESTEQAGLKPLWQCSEGHQFIQILKNIRLHPLGKRKCSWCPTCRKLYKTEFLWNPELSHRSPSTTSQSLPDPPTPNTLFRTFDKQEKLQQRRDYLLQYIRERNGTIHSPEELLFPRQWRSKVQLTCQNQHTWNASIKSLLYDQRWCAKCAARLSEESFVETARHFNGSFLGLLPPSDTPSTAKFTNLSNQYRAKKESLSLRLARWQCDRGHIFVQKLANIRNRRACLWCPLCRKEGKIRFRWE